MSSSLEQRAIGAATAVARAHGLRVEHPVPLGRASNVLVHLRPAPVVARVMTATVVLHANPRAWLEREVGVAAHAARRGAAVVAPSGELPPGPHEHDGLWLTFWELAEVLGPPDHPAAPVGAALRALHDALADYPGELEPITAVREAIERLRPTPAQQAELDRVAPVVFRPAAQPLHGDASFGNLLPTPRGLLWNDFEDTCRGPAAWDVAGVVEDAQRRRGERFAAELLAAYGPCEPLEPFVAVHHVYRDAWRAHPG
jgi:hypothetical protein